MLKNVHLDYECDFVISISDSSTEISKVKVDAISAVTGTNIYVKELRRATRVTVEGTEPGQLEAAVNFCFEEFGWPSHIGHGSDYRTVEKFLEPAHVLKRNVRTFWMGKDIFVTKDYCHL